ncbi:BON domain-containing protein [Rhizobium rhizogenes]|nr:BON domain-containing protein [Rhizobium rhizogenes]NTI26534.1 BON domain-containing protein [Rhizobium rhizogenes]NTI78144.1 BON domain-containing protein [Rhizobium rhizogenes]QTG10005.1 BON domain-containing protein [Rhizobium rhizogenes]
MTDDITLRQDILDELEFEPSIDATNIGIAVANGIVTLTGHVSSYSQKETAERVVKRMTGVRGIFSPSLAPVADLQLH